MYSNQEYEKVQGMRVKKRNGNYEDVTFDEISKRIKDLCKIKYLPVEYTGTKKVGQPLEIDPIEVAQKVCAALRDGISTSELDELAASMAESMSAIHPDYGVLAANIIVDNNHKSTHPYFFKVMELAHKNLDEDGELAPLISDEAFQFIEDHAVDLEEMIDYSRDFMFDYFGFKTLERSYLIKQLRMVEENNTRKMIDVVIERPQHMKMREAIISNLATKSLPNIKKTYDALTKGYYTHATPTMFNACGPRPQLSSCFLINMEDSLDGILKTHNDCGQISKWAGGIGMSIHKIRAKGSRIRGTNGKSTGIVQMLKMFNETANYINQGGKRNGSFAIYLEPFHADIMDFLDLRKTDGDESARARDLFYALWIPDLFMKKLEAAVEYNKLFQEDPQNTRLESLKEESIWYLMCPDRCPGLSDCHGPEFEELYNKYVSEKKYNKAIPILNIWDAIINSQIETGTPYMLYKDACNQKSNQKNLGTIHSSNLCVSPDTAILTDKGYIKIGDNTGKRVRVWNGYEYSNTTVKQTGFNKEMLKVKLSNGYKLKCTTNHKFYIINKKGMVVEVNADSLKKGMEIVTCTYPVIKEGKDYNDAQFDPTIIPLDGNLESKIKWIDNYLEFNGEQLDTFILNSLDKTFVYTLSLFFNTLGVSTCITKQKENEKAFSLSLSDSSVKQLVNLGLKSNLVTIRLDYTGEISFTTDRVYKHNEIVNRVPTVVSVKNAGTSDTYCFNESIRHTGVFNGILTGQCSEIVEYTDKNNVSVCNLCSIALSRFVRNENGKMVFDHDKLHEITRLATRNLDEIIDVNYYPIPETKYSNMNHRPIGIGVQGLADTFIKLRMPFESPEAAQLNKEIFETIYYSFLVESAKIAQEKGHYNSYQGSPASMGILQHNLWGLQDSDLSSRWNWKELRNDIKKYGLRNSLGTALMPTASTSQILGNFEAFEPIKYNIYTRFKILLI